MRLAVFFEALSNIFRLFGSLMRLWPFMLIALLLLMPATPHIRWTYQYILYGTEKHFVRCTYLGASGLITPDFPPQCPFFALINPDHWR
ncbi:MAG: hypothetical protein ACSHYC_21950 [Alphaproteobacteria bacterium]